MPRFFVQKQDIEDGKIRILGDDAFHIARSLRMAAGDSVEVSDGEGNDYLCRLDVIRDDVCLCSAVECMPSRSEPKIPITLYMAYPKGDKLETVVQKAVELGASRIVPFSSSRCIKRPQDDKKEAQTARLRRIAHEAAKQCGRGRLPNVELPIKFSELLPEIKEYGITLFCYEGEGAVSLKTVLECCGYPESIAVIVGSEGGFSKEEAQSICAAGAKCVNLGPRILRCETAPDYVLSSLSYFFEL